MTRSTVTFSSLLRMDFADARDHIEDGSVDLLHIDGLHTYEAVRMILKPGHPR